MRKRSLNAGAFIGSWAFVCLFLAGHCWGQAVRQPTTAQQESLKKFLQNYLNDPLDNERTSTRYQSAFVDLEDNGGGEAIVYFTEHLCGSGGCDMLILVPEGSSYRIISAVSIVQLPVRVLARKSHGWHDIAVWVQGGGIQPGYEAELPFNGKAYPRSAFIPPARRLRHKVPGKIVISWKPESQTIPLYP